MKKNTNSEKETIQLGQDFAKELKGGEVILLIGDLGAGKTTFVKGVAKQFGIKKHVTSPTFVLMKVYEVKGDKLKVKSIKKLIHIDTYRGLGIDDLENIGAIDFFGCKDTVCFVEWGAGLEKYLNDKKNKVIKIQIENNSINSRTFSVN